MSLELRLLLSVGLAFGLVLATTPLVIRVANRFNFHDRPASGYKDHARPTPYLGGLAVIGSFIVAVALLSGSPGRTLPVIGGVIVLWVLGTVDDKLDISPGIRVLIEAALATGLWALNLGWNLGIGDGVDLALTILWVLAVVNAINLFDNMDGQASTMACVISAAISILGVVNGDQWAAVTGAALAGACLGFLRYNLAKPARIFLGDGGSMPIGFALSALVMIGASESAVAAQALAMGVLFVGVPALDTALVIISRRRRGISVLTGGRDHLTHRSRERLRTATAVAFALGGSQAVLAALALASYRQGSVALVVVVLVYLLLAGGLIAFLDRPTLPEGTPSQADEQSQEGEDESDGQRRLAGVRWEAVLLVLLAGAVAASPWFFGAYDSSIWAPAGLVLLVIIIALEIGRPAPITKPAAISLLGLSGLAIWSLISSSWSAAPHFAVVNADRWIFYALALAVLLMLVRDTKLGAVLLTANGLGILAVVLVIYFRLAGSDPNSLLAGGRLNSPVEYINGLGTYLAMGLWGAIAVAEQRRKPLLAGLGAGIGALMVPLLQMGQSRGVTVALLVSFVLVVAVVPGRLRRVGLLALLAGVAFADSNAVHIAFTSRLTTLSSTDAQSILTQTILVALIAGVAWTLLSLAVERIRESSPARLASIRKISAGLLAGVGVVALVFVAINGTQITSGVKKVERGFTDVNGGSRVHRHDTRLLSGNGNRYDYWRVSADLWKENPIIGSGAGSFSIEYALKRRTTENVRQPHSLEMETLGELGLVGIVLLVVFLAPVFMCAIRRGRNLGTSSLERVVLVAPLGAFTVWLVDVSVDWVHLLTGVSAIAVCAAAVLVRPSLTASDGGSEALIGSHALRPGARWVATVLAAVGLVGAGALLGQLALTDRYINRARTRTDQRAALADANRALRLDPTIMDAYFAKAIALSQLGDPGGADKTLLEAARREPRNSVVWALLADLELQQQHSRAGQRYAQKALSLAPRDPQILTLLGEASLQLGELDKAEGFARRARSADQTDPGIVIVLAKIAQARGDNAQALKDFETALALDPSNKDVKVLIARLKRQNGN